MTGDATRRPQHDIYPTVRDCSPPSYLHDRYGSVEALLDEVAAVAADALPPFDIQQIADRFPTILELYEATADELADSFNVSSEAAQRYRVLTQRYLVWEDPHEVAFVLETLFDRVIQNLPRTLTELEESGGGRDLLDPFIVAFTSELLSTGSTSDLLRLLAAHKCLMKLEDLIGNLHQEALGPAAGGDRVPEPQGVPDASGRRNKEVWHEELNPYPGADARRGSSEFYQIKNKTGSAKGSDGEKLGRQFQVLEEKYPGSKRYYVSMIGRTLKGHRSMGAFLRTSPNSEVLVGLAAFQQLGRHRDTADIVLELYLEAFDDALERNHYDFDEIVSQMTAEWVEKHGSEDPVYGMLYDTIMPEHPFDQSSETYDPKGNYSNRLF